MARKLGKGQSAPRKQPGSMPGTLVYTGQVAVGQAHIHHIDYGHEHLVEGDLTEIGECFPLFGTESVTWVDVRGLADVDSIRSIAEHVGLHRLIAEDIVSTSQRPKVEPYPKHLFVVLRMLSLAPDGVAVEDEQVSFVLGPNFVLSFQEREGDVFEPVRRRLREARGFIRERGPDYLAYALMDAVVDHYFVVIERLGDQVDELEARVLNDGDEATVRGLHRVKREVIAVRRAVWPLREVLGSMFRGETELITSETRTYLRDVYDHSIQVADTVESLRDVTSGVMDLHLSFVSNRMNEVMKVLTIMSTIFIPLGFLAGLYGMNFVNMPELGWPYGYPALLTVMLVTVLAMLWFFRRKGWM